MNRLKLLIFTPTNRRPLGKFCTFNAKFRLKISCVVVTLLCLTVAGYAQSSSPTVTIDGIIGSSGTIRINYTAYDADSDSVTTTCWQYSRDNSNWYDITEDAIQNNDYKPSGTSYITWNSSLTLLGVYDNSVWLKMKVADNNSQGNINSFSTSNNNIPTAISELSSVVYNDYLYVTGGYNGSSGIDKVYYAKLNADGSVGSFSTASNNIPAIVYEHSSVVYNGYLYVTGGHRNTIYYAKLNADGSVGSFSTASNNIPTTIYEHSSVVYNGYLYITGGSNGNCLNTVYYAKLNADGSVGSFNTASNNIPAIVYEHSSVAYNGYLYITGGYSYNSLGILNTVYYAKLNSDGSVGSFSTSSIPASIYSHSSVVYNNYLYITGGFTNKVYYAKLNNDGSVGNFSTAINNIPISLSVPSSVVNNGYLYVTGGRNNDSYLNTVYYTSFANLVSTYAAVSSSSFLLDNNTPPMVTVTSPSEQQTGNVNIPITISDTASDTLSVFCEYSTDNGVNWSTATVLGNTSFADYINYSGTIIWQSDVNIYNSSASVKFRITPSDSRSSGTATETSSFVVDNQHSPYLTITDVSENTDEPSGTIKISYTGSDPDGSLVQTVNWQYSRDNTAWYDISSSAISNNSYKSPGSSYIYWDTQSGTNNLNLVEDSSVWFRMRLTDGTFYSSTKSTGSFTIDNYTKPYITISTIPGEITASTITVSYVLTAAPDENLTILPEYSIGGTDWSHAAVGGSTYNITSANFSGSLSWYAGQDLSLGTDSSIVYFRITPSGRVLGNATTTNAIHIDYNAAPSVAVTDIFTVVRDTVTIQYTLTDINSDALNIVCQYSTNSGNAWKSATVVGSTSNITSANYSGSVVWYSNLDEPIISTVTAKFKITPYDNDTGTADDTLNFQVINVGEPPSATITSVENNSGAIRINYTTSDPDAGEQIITTGWQYSLDNTNWNDINSDAIENNYYKSTGSSYIVWISTLTLSDVYDDSVWFRMKIADNSGIGNISTFITSTNSIPTDVCYHSSVIYNSYLYITGGENNSSTRLNTVYYAKINNDGSIGSFILSPNRIPTGVIRNSSVVHNGYLYITGGNNGNRLNAVYYAKLNSDGSVGSFTLSPNNIPTTVDEHSSVVYNGYLYITGGRGTGSRLNTVYYAKLNSDGSVGSFTLATNTIPIFVAEHSSVVNNGYLYITGGEGSNDISSSIKTNTIYYAKLNSDGSVGSFSTASNYIPVSLYAHSSVVCNSYIYITGGSAGGRLNTVYYANTNADGSVGSFILSANTIPNAVYIHSSVANNGYFYISGGYGSDNSSGGRVNTIYYTSFANLRSNYATSSSFAIHNDVPIDITAPSVPTLISPENNSTVMVSSVTFDWSDSTDIESGVANYELQISTDANFGMINHTATTVISSSTFSLLTSTAYYWRVRAKDVTNNVSDWSSSWSVTVNIGGIVTETISGKVTKSDGLTGLTGCVVELWQNGSRASSTTTNTDGTYQFINISTGVYDVRASSSPSYVSRLTSSVVVAASSTTTVNFALEAGGTVEQYEVTVSTYTTAGSTFTIVISAKNSNNDTITGYSGTVNIQSVLTGNDSLAGGGVLSVTNAALSSGTVTIANQTYTKTENIKIKVTDSNNKTGLSNTITVIPSSNRTISISANPASVISEQPTSLTAEVKDYYDNPVPNLTVNFAVVTGSGTLNISSGTTDTNGKLTSVFVPVGSGECKIQATSDGLTSAEVSVTVSIVVAPNTRTEVTATDDAKTKIIVPPGTFDRDTKVNIKTKTDVPINDGQHFEITAKDKETDAEVTNLNRSVELVFHFQTSGGMVSNTNVPLLAADAKERLAVFYYDGVTWQKIGGTIDLVNQIISVNVTHFSLYAVKETVKATRFQFSGIGPNPFTPNPDGVQDRVYFYFENPENKDVEIKVFDLDGSLVKNIPTTAGVVPFWDGKNNNETMMEGGVYFYRLRVGENVVSGTIVLGK